jgi:hypothetical protein
MTRKLSWAGLWRCELWAYCRQLLCNRFALRLPIVLLLVKLQCVAAARKLKAPRETLILKQKKLACDRDRVHSVFVYSQLAHFKIPYYISFVDAYPLTVSGKVQKFKMREMALKMYGIQPSGNWQFVFFVRIKQCAPNTSSHLCIFIVFCMKGLLLFPCKWRHEAHCRLPQLGANDCHVMPVKFRQSIFLLRKFFLDFICCIIK